MKLADWLRKSGVSRIEFSRRLGLTPGAVSQLCNHESVWMSRDTAQAIARETQGAVTPNDFLPDVAGEDKMLEASMSQSVPLAVEAISRGEIVIVTDDDDRENEGDLVMAASLCTPEKMAFIIRNCCGIVCAPLTRRRGASPASEADGGRKRRAARHRLHRHRSMSSTA